MPEKTAEWFTRAVKARKELSAAIQELRGGVFAARMDRCDLALAELDIVLGLAPYRTGQLAPPSLPVTAGAPQEDAC